jgi:hypothetical protein
MTDREAGRFFGMIVFTAAVVLVLARLIIKLVSPSPKQKNDR